MSETVVIPAGTQLDRTHVALKDIKFNVERHGDVYSAIWAGQQGFGIGHRALAVDDAVWLAQKDLGELLDWIGSDDEDADWARDEIGQALRESVGQGEGTSKEEALDGATIEGYLLEAGDGYEWSSLFISGMGLAEALAAALRVEKQEHSYIQLWGCDDEGNDIDPHTTIVTVAEEEESLPRNERLFYDFGRVRITVERITK